MKLLIVILSLLLSTIVFAIDEEKIINSAYVAYQKEAYDEVLDILGPVQFEGRPEMALKAYMMALSYNRVEEFSNALQSFKTAMSFGAKQQDIHYEMGQALYAMNELKHAKKEFIDSYNLGFKKVPSLYYLGHISQLLDEGKQAKRYFLEIAKNKKADKNLRQIATFQLAEVIFEKFKDSNYLIKNVVRRYILPLLNEAIEVDSKSELADEIRERKRAILYTYKLDTIILSNGREISKKRWLINAGLNEKMDSNVTYAADDPASSTVSKESSLITEGTFYGKYNIIPNKSWVVTPSVSGSFLKHHSSEPLVYTNDEYKWSVGLSNSFEHSMFKAPASVLFDVNYTYRAKDYMAEESIEFYEEQYDISFGERFNIFKAGETVVKGLYRMTKSYNEDNDTTTFGGNISQTALIMNKHYLMLYGAAEFETADNPVNESDVYTLSGTYYIPALYKRLDMSLGYSFMMISTDLKGTEMTHIPYMELTQNMGKMFDLKGKVEYTKNMADDPQFEYSKYVLSLGVNFNY